MNGFLSIKGNRNKKLGSRSVQLCNPMDYSVHEIFQARILEWLVMPFSKGSSQSRDQTQVSHIAG